MLRKRLAYLARSPYVYLATLLNAILVALGAWLHSVSPEGRPWAFTLLACLLLTICVVDIFVKVLHDRREAFVVYETFINGLLEVAAVAMLKAAGPPKDSMRVNVMLPDEKNQNLSIKYHHGFISSDRDRYINIPINAGCAGQAWLLHAPIVADPTLLFSPLGIQWGLPPNELKKIRPTLQSIFSIPIEVGSECIGVLNFDSDNSKDNMKFDDEGVQLVGFSFASVLAVVLQQSP
jgi:hypothetical protein